MPWRQIPSTTLTGSSVHIKLFYNTTNTVPAILAYSYQLVWDTT